MELEKQQAHTTTAHAVSVSKTRRGAAVGAAIALALSAHVHAAVAKPVSITIDPAKLTSQVCANPRAAGTPGRARAGRTDCQTAEPPPSVLPLGHYSECVCPPTNSRLEVHHEPCTCTHTRSCTACLTYPSL